jgi:4-amino-4-deoxy-L-arabinose transferase-like glycosyltransferase
MTSVRAYRVPSPLPLPLLLVLCAAYLLPGLFDHDPWKADDAVSLGVVFEAAHGNWLTPTLAGEPFPQVSPLFFWVAAIFGKLLSPLLPLHLAARLASAAFTGAAIAFTAFAARELLGATAAITAALLFTGCAGLLLPAHAMGGELALLAALAAVIWGLSLIPRRPLLAGAIVGCGLGAAFLAHGIAPALTALLLTAIIALIPSNRPRTAGFFGVLALAAMPWLVVWPLALYVISPHNLGTWWEASNLAELPWTSDANPLAQGLSYVKLLGWFAWPAWPLALWTLWQFRRRLIQLALPIAAFVLFLLMLSFGSDAREITAVSLLLPLSLLGAGSVGELRRGAANALDWFGMMTFTLFLVLVWTCFVAMQSGVPAEIAQRFAKAEPGYVARFNAVGFAIALVFTLAWVFLMIRTERSPHRSLTHWTAGVVVAWGVATSVLMPWIDYGRSYRAMSAELLQQVVRGDCLSSRNLGEPQRASLQYFAGLVTHRAEVENTDCRLMLVQGSANDDSGNPGTGWDLVWQGNRPGDRNERYRLYRRQN